MLRSLFILLAIFFAAPSCLSACSCVSFYAESFCEYQSTPRLTNPFNVFRARTLERRTVPIEDQGFDQVFLDVIIMDVLKGSDLVAGDTLTLVSEGEWSMCAGNVHELDPELDHLFQSYEIESPGAAVGIGLPENSITHSFVALPFCGVSSLPIRNDTITGPITGFFTEMPYADFKEGFAGCRDYDVAVVDRALDRSLSVFPNPARDLLNVRWGGQDVRSIALYDSAGRLLVQRQADQAVQTKFDLTGYVPGVYFLRVATPGGIATRRIIVTH